MTDVARNEGDEIPVTAPLQRFQLEGDEIPVSAPLQRFQLQHSSEKLKLETSLPPVLAPLKVHDMSPDLPPHPRVTVIRPFAEKQTIDVGLD